MHSKSTQSLCPICLSEIKALIYKKGKNILMKKNCKAHGSFDSVLELHHQLYQKLQAPVHRLTHSFKRLNIPITDNCNLDCNICYYPKASGKNECFRNIKRQIDNFDGRYVNISGGEPTVHPQIFRITNYLVKKKKYPTLVTNGLKLEDNSFLTRLSQAGLEKGSIVFSFNSFDDRIYRQINNKNLLKTKLRALKNLERYKGYSVLSMLLVRSLNEKEFDKIFGYCVENDFIKEFRVRSSSIVGKHTAAEPFRLSEILELFTKKLNIGQKDFMDRINNKYGLYATCRLTFNLYFYKEKKNYEFLMYILKKKPGYGFASLINMLKLLKNIGMQHLVKIVRREASIRMLKIEIRSWPNKYTIDLNELKYCQTGQMNENMEILPFCYSLVKGLCSQ